jgi:hypothetical protein
MNQELLNHFQSKHLSIEERITSPFAFLRGGADQALVFAAKSGRIKVAEAMS